MPSLSMLQVHIHADAHTHTDNTQIDPDTPHWFPKPSSPTPPDGEPCGNAPCAEVSGWEMGMSQFSEVEWPLPFDLYHGVQSNFLGSPGLHFASWICLVTWKMQVAFCEKMIPHSDSGPQPQSPASACFQERH